MLATLAPGLALAQAPPRSIPSFRTAVRRVLVPVTVLNGKGQVVRGLRRKDFGLLVDGRRVRIRSVDWIHAEPATMGAPGKTGARANHQPPGVFTNRSHRAPPSWVVLLIDFQNTPLDDMMWMRAGVLRFLRRDLRPGQPVAIFGVSDGLLMLQPFTYNRRRLLAAAGEWIQPRLDYNLAFSPPRISAVGASPSGIPRRENTAWGDLEAMGRGAGISSTDGVLRQLAATLAPLPGRKVVIWAGDGPPLAWDPAWSSSSPSELLQALPEANADRWRERASTYELLNEADVELFPLDPCGIALAIPMAYRAGLPMRRQSQMLNTPGLSSTSDGVGRNPVRSAGQMLSWSAMQDAAHQTGGKALIGDNFLWQSLGQAQREWSNYYLLSFQPPRDPRGEVRYHHIRVAVDRPGLSVQARQGYITRAPQVLRVEHPRPGFGMGAASMADLSGIPLQVHLGGWWVQGKQRFRGYRFSVPLGGAGCRHGSPCQLIAGVVVSGPRGRVVGQRGYLVKLRRGLRASGRIGLRGRITVRRRPVYLVRFMVRAMPSGRFGEVVIAVHPPKR
jgi:VWFA-related protein